MRFELATRYNDYDTKGHINNAVYLTYFEIAREKAWLHSVKGDPDFPFVVAEARVTYVSEAMIGEQLDVEITTSEVRNKAWVWSYVVREVTEGRVVAEGSTVQVMFDYDARKSTTIPDDLKPRLLAV